MNKKKLIVYFLRATFSILLTVINAAAQAPVPLGTAATYAVLGGSTVTNTGNSTVTGDLGVSPGTAVTGFPPGTVTGTIRTAAAAAPAQADLLTAYNDAAGRQPVATVATELGGQTLVPGVYDSAAGTFEITGTLTLDGQNNPNAVFIFKMASTLTTAAGAPGTPASRVLLIRGAQACNVFWQVGSSATLGTYSIFQGSILALSSITATTGASVNGRVLARNGAVTLDTNAITTPVCSASIQIVKNAVGGDSTFAFTSNFGLSSLSTVGGTASQTFNDVIPGSSYSFTETVPVGWSQSSATCTNGTPAAITVVAGETTTCTVTNTLISLPSLGTIQIVKNAVGGNGTFTFTSNFGLTSLTTANGTASQTFNNVSPGSGYTFTETVPAGWTQSSATCTNGTPAGITVVAGATTTCTVTNTILAAPPPPLTGSIQVVKNTIGGDGRFNFTSNFGLSSLTTAGGSSSQTFSGLAPGSSYSLSETVPSGWTQTSATCTDGTPSAITVVAGDTTTCTITNTAAQPLTGSIRVIKNTIGGNGRFNFTSNFGLTSLTTAGGTASQTFSSLTAGNSYSLNETVPAGWTQTSATCTVGTPNAITVVSGLTTTCTITNTLAQTLPGSIQVIKNTVGGNGTFNFTSNFGLTSLTTAGGTASQTFSSLTAGNSYSLNETVPAGWTQTSATCTNGTPSAIAVAIGETTTCTITNTLTPGTPVADLTIGKSHAGDFQQGDIGATYTLTVTNTGPAPTTGAVNVSDLLPVGLTATAIDGPGWSCTLVPLACTRSDALAAGGSYPGITVTVNVANDSGGPVNPSNLNPAFRADDILVSMADGTIQWRRSDLTPVKVLTSGTDGQAKGMAFDRSGNLYVTHWIGSGSSGNNIARFDGNGNFTGFFGTGFDCNPSSIAFDNNGNAYVGHADCSGQILKLDSLGNRLAQYDVAVENRGSYHVVLDPDQCTMYYTSQGPNVKRFNVCTNTQLPNFNAAPLPNAVEGAHDLSLLPGGGMLVANFSVIARLDASGTLVATYKTASGNQCWLGTQLDLGGISFLASNWCSSSITRFNIETGSVIESHVVDDHGFTVKQIIIPGNIFGTVVTNIATVAGGGEVNTSNNSATDPTTINPSPQPRSAIVSANVVNAASYVPTVAAGSIASILGTNLASGDFVIGGRGASLLYSSSTQVNLQVPWELAGQNLSSVTGTIDGAAFIPRTVALAPFAPGIFTLNGAGTGQGLLLIAGTTLLAAPPSATGRRAVSGEVLSIYSTGLGPVSNQPSTGLAALSGPLSITTSIPTVTIGGIETQVNFSGLAPGTVGLYQVNVVVPEGVTAGDSVPVTLRIGGATSNTVTIAVE